MSGRSSPPHAAELSAGTGTDVHAHADGVLPLLELDRARRWVALDGQPMAVVGRAFDLLAVLASRPGRVFSPAELFAAVWPGRVVEEANLRVQVTALRKQLGAQRVLNVAGRGYALTVRTAATAWTPSTSVGRLPQSSEPLLGRDDDLAALLALLREHRLVTLQGPGGIGKTRLAVQAAQRSEHLRPQGVRWVDLSGLPQDADEVAVAQCVAQALGVQVPQLDGPAAALALGRSLTQWSGLMLLDNADYLAATSGCLPGLLRAWLAAAPDLQVLVTSQQALRLSQEWVYQLGPLAVPVAEAGPELVRANPAVQLLLQRARAVDQRFRLTDQELVEAATLVRQLDGLPLAIEMAAARLPMFGLPGLLRHLGDRLRLLGDGVQGVPVRHGTLRAAMDWSFGLLSAEERRAMLQLSLFAAPCRLDVAQTVLAAPGHGPAEALRLLQGLVGKSLLQVQHPSSPEAPRRLRMLESTRHYAAEALAQLPVASRDEALLRHARAMAAVARQAKQDLYRAGDADWLVRWLPDHDDAMLAFDRALALGDADAASELIELLVLSANVTGQVSPAVARMAAARRLAGTAQGQVRARLINFTMPQSVQSHDRLQAAQERLEAWRAVGDRRGICTALAAVALAAEASQDRSLADAALARCLALEDPHWPARLRRRCGWIALSGMALSRGDPLLVARAIRLSGHLLPSLEAAQATGEALLVRTFLAQALRLQGRPVEALQSLRQTVAALRGTGRDFDLAQNLGVLSAVLLEQPLPPAPDARALALAAARLQEARLAATEALQRLRPFPVVMRHFLEPLAWLAARSGDLRTAAVWLAACVQARRTIRTSGDEVNQRIGELVQQQVEALLDPEELAAAWHEGECMALEDLRGAVLLWLSQQENASAPASAQGQGPSAVTQAAPQAQPWSGHDPRPSFV